MPIYAIGDIQGCAEELWRLLDRLRFDPAGDRLWFVGDLVNRGPDSLEVLRLVHSLDPWSVVVLGNHDLHLLALASGNSKHSKKSNLGAVLEAPDREELLHWLRHRPLMHHDGSYGFSLVHAGLPPQWTLEEALDYARELEGALRGSTYREFLAAMYGDKPARWSPELSGMERLRFITNCLTRLRYCTVDGMPVLKEKRGLDARPQELIPWFQCPGRKTWGDRIIFGHWSSLGYWARDDVWGIDGGCLWGGHLIALRLHQHRPPEPIYLPCAGYLTPGGLG